MNPGDAQRLGIRIGASRIGPNAHVMGVDPSTHRVYFPLKDVDGRPVLRVTPPRRVLPFDQLALAITVVPVLAVGRFTDYPQWQKVKVSL